jgi:CRISPR-associated protein Cas5h
MEILSFDMRASMGCFKKPDINDLYLTYNLLHRPGFLGILGAILGLGGFQEGKEWPEYYRILKNLPIGIQPLNHSSGNFQKTEVRYNNGVGYASLEEGGNLIIREQTLIRPAYRCYVGLDQDTSVAEELKERIMNHEAVYLPYFGKNEFYAYWENPGLHSATSFEGGRVFRVRSIFQKSITVKDAIRGVEPKKRYTLGIAKPGASKGTFVYFERLPVRYDEKLRQHSLEEFSFTDHPLSENTQLPDLYSLNGDPDQIVQLFL